MTSTKIAKLSRILTLILGLVLFFVPVTILAQSAPNCNPWPDAVDQIQACIDYYSQNPQTTKAPGTDPSHPVALPLDGVGGIDAAYSPKLDQTLVVSPKGSPEFSHIEGLFIDPKTIAPIGTTFQIDQGQVFSRGSPRIIYAGEVDKFFVTWEDGRPCSTCRSTYGRILDGTGKPEGKDIAISTKVGFLGNAAYDPTNKKFVVLYEPGFVEIKTLDLAGNVDAKSIAVSNNPNIYQGQGSVTVSTQSDQYWVSYLTATGSGSSEDDRVWFARFDAKTGAQIGTPQQLSQTRIGHDNLIGSQIAYDSADGRAVAAWTEYGRDGVAGVWGRTINSDGTLGNEFPIFTLSTSQTSEGFGLSSLKYNPYTDSFFVGSGDWNGSANTAEFDDNGLIYNSTTSISAVGLGSFNIAIAPTTNGAVTLTSQSYTSIVGTSQRAVSTIVPPPSPVPPPVPPAPISFGGLGIQVNQIYIWSLGAAALLALFMIVVGGYITLTAAGNAERATRGKTFITSSVIGLILLFGSYLLLRTINPDLVDFSNNSANTTQIK